jgi:hypothetical protein
LQSKISPEKCQFKIALKSKKTVAKTFVLDFYVISIILNYTEERYKIPALAVLTKTAKYTIKNS